MATPSSRPLFGRLVPAACLALALALAFPVLTACPFGGDDGGGPAPPPFCDGDVLVVPATRGRVPCAGACHEFPTGEAGCFVEPLVPCERLGGPVCLGDLLARCVAPGYVAEGGDDCAADGRACADVGAGGCVYADVTCPPGPDAGAPLAFCAPAPGGTPDGPDARAYYARCLGGRPAERWECAAGTSCRDYVEPVVGPDQPAVAGAECVLPIACDGAAGALSCAADESAVLTCGGHGAVIASAACGAGARCRATGGAVECVAADLVPCDEGEGRCTWDGDGVQACGATGYLLPVADCDDLDWDAVCVEEWTDDGWRRGAGCHVPPDCDAVPAACDEEQDWLLVCERGELVRAEFCDWGCEEATADEPAQCD